MRVVYSLIAATVAATAAFSAVAAYAPDEGASLTKPPGLQQDEGTPPSMIPKYQQDEGTPQNLITFLQ